MKEEKTNDVGPIFREFRDFDCFCASVCVYISPPPLLPLTIVNPLANSIGIEKWLDFTSDRN